MMKKESDTNSVTVPPAPRTYLDSQRALILQALRATRWIVGGLHGAGVRLGLKRTTLISKMKKLRISRPVSENHADRLLEEKRDPEMTATNS